MPETPSSVWLQARWLWLAALAVGLVACFDFTVPGSTVQFDYDGDDPVDPTPRCIDDDDCAVRQICTRGLCGVGCRANADCPTGEICAGSPALCVNSLECRRDEDCGGEAPVCHPTLSICVTCTQASDCPGEDVCLIAPPCLAGVRSCNREDYTCGLCTSDAQCPSSVCDEETGRCVECVDETRCQPGEVCDRAMGVCTGCVDNADCAEPLPACLRTETGGQCVLCAVDADCDEGTCNRDTNSCKGCLSDEDCQGASLRCNPGSGLCFDSACAFREVPELIELVVEAEVAAPFLAGPPAAASVRDNDGDGVPSLGDRPEYAIPMSPPQDTQPALALWTARGEFQAWSASASQGAVRGVAMADLDGDGRVETVALRGGRLTALSATGSPVWTSGSRTTHLPSLFDVDGDGFAEVVAGGSLFSEVGQRIWVGTAHQGGHVGLGLPGLGLAAQLDGEGPLEIIAGGTVYSAQGEVRCTEGLDGYTAVADLEGDGTPELVVVSADGAVRALRGSDCGRVWGPVLAEGAPGTGGGPPTIVDLDADQDPEVVFVAGDDLLVAVDHLGVVVWTRALEGAHPSAGVSAVDLDGDGRVEVLVSDSLGLHVLRGEDGFVLTSHPAGASTLALAAPMVLDIDDDGSMEIVVASGGGAGSAEDKLVVFGDVRDRWADARNVWNQVNYFVANIQDNLRAPPFLGAWWEEGHLVRSQPIEVTAEPAPNLQVRRLPGAVDLGDCPDRYTVAVAVYNRGLTEVRPGATVTARLPDRSTLLAAATTRRLAPGDQEVLVMTFDNLFGPVDVDFTVARSDEEEVRAPECAPDDNTLRLEAIGCPDTL